MKERERGSGERGKEKRKVRRCAGRGFLLLLGQVAIDLRVPKNPRGGWMERSLGLPGRSPAEQMGHPPPPETLPVPGAGEHMGSSGGPQHGRAHSQVRRGPGGTGGARHGSVPAPVPTPVPGGDARPRPDGQRRFGVGMGDGRNAPTEEPCPPCPPRAPRGHLLATGTGPSGGEPGRQTSRIYQLLATADFCICQGANYCL